MLSRLVVFFEYLNHIPNAEHRARVEEILQWTADTFPELEPKYAWKQPMFTAHGTFIIGFSISKLHIAVSPEKALITHFAKDFETAGYDYSSHIFRIKWKESVNYPLLEKIIRYNIEDKADCQTFWRK